MNYVRLYADDRGESHFEDVDVSLTSVDFAPPAPPLDLSDFIEARRFTFLRAPAGWSGDWHPAPARQFLVVVEGAFEVTASDGETRRLATGAVVLLEDTEGKGHASRVVGDGAAAAAVVQL